MARFIADYPVGKPDDFIRLVTEDYLGKEGFKPVLYKGEWMWKKGTGMLTAPQYIKLAYGGGVVHIEAFLRYAVLPGVYVGEMGLDGGWGFLVKDMLRSKVNEMVRLLYQPLPGEPVMQTAPVPAVPAGGGQPAGAPLYDGAAPAVPPAPAPIPVAVHNPTGKATLGFVFGLCSIVGVFISLLGIVFAVAGLINSRTGLKSTSRGLALAGMILSIVFLVVSVFDGVAGIFLALVRLA